MKEEKNCYKNVEKKLFNSHFTRPFICISCVNVRKNNFHMYLATVKNLTVNLSRVLLWSENSLLKLNEIIFINKKI